MPDLVVTLLVIIAVLLLADLLLAGGAMTMTGMSGFMGLVAHPIATVTLLLLVAIVIVVLGR